VVPGSHRWADAEVERLLAEIDFATVPEGDRVPRLKDARPAWFQGELLDVVTPASRRHRAPRHPPASRR